MFYHVYFSGMRLVSRQCTPTTQVSGDGVDNDCDGSVDEELCNGVDDDADNAVDEDCGGILPSKNCCLNTNLLTIFNHY